MPAYWPRCPSAPAVPCPSHSETGLSSLATCSLVGDLQSERLRPAIVTSVHMQLFDLSRLGPAFGLYRRPRLRVAPQNYAKRGSAPDVPKKARTLKCKKALQLCAQHTHSWETCTTRRSELSQLRLRVNVPEGVIWWFWGGQTAQSAAFFLKPALARMHKLQLRGTCKEGLLHEGDPQTSVS